MARILFLNLVVFSIFLYLGKAFEIEVENETIRFNYIRGSNNGPERWGVINPQWRTCNTGNMQSPIDLSIQCIKATKDWEGLQVHYKPASAVISSKGQYIDVTWEGDAGGITLEGTYYNLSGVHWHHPSEHTLDGRRYNLELHAVHSTSNAKLIVAVLYAYSKPDPFLSQIIPNLNFNNSEGTNARIIINPNDVYFPNSSYYRYMGSFTTPPCTEGVTWMVAKEVKTVSYFQVQALRRAVDVGFEYNVRPLQPINAREILLYNEGYKNCCY